MRHNSGMQGFALHFCVSGVVVWGVVVWGGVVWGGVGGNRPDKPAYSIG